MFRAVLLPPLSTGMMWSNSSLSWLPHVVHFPPSRRQTRRRTASGIGTRRFAGALSSFSKSSTARAICPNARSWLRTLCFTRVRTSFRLAAAASSTRTTLLRNAQSWPFRSDSASISSFTLDGYANRSRTGRVKDSLAEPTKASPLGKEPFLPIFPMIEIFTTTIHSLACAPSPLSARITRSRGHP